MTLGLQTPELPKARSDCYQPVCNHLTNLLPHELLVDIAEVNGRQIDGGASGVDNTLFNTGWLHQVRQAAGDDILVVVDNLEVGSTGGGTKFWGDCLGIERQHNL